MQRMARDRAAGRGGWPGGGEHAMLGSRAALGRMTVPPRAWILALGLAGLPACAGETGPPPVRPLALGFRPTPLRAAAAWGPDGLPADGDPWTATLRLAIPDASWERRAEGGGEVWFAPVPPTLARGDPERARLWTGTEERTRAAPGRWPAARGFRFVRGGVWVRSGREDPPHEASLEVVLSSGSESDGRWTVGVGERRVSGIPVWSGGRERCVVDLPPASALRFVAVHSGQAQTEPARFRVLVAGVVVAEVTLPPDAEPRPVTVELAPGGERGVELAFEVLGPPGLGVFADPVIGPLSIGSYDARPWPRTRPDIVLFLADTYRADNLAAYGGDPAIAPHLNRLADESVCFVESRSSAAWTLPSTAAILTGFYPPTIGVQSSTDRLADAAVTLAERFAHAGYRTGAITDALFVSPHFGLAQGFDWFSPRDYKRWSLAATVADARAFLERDDGRPVFLVVHTYRAHGPYRTGEEESQEAVRALGARSRIEGEHGKSQRLARAAGLYRDGAHALDAGFGRFRAMLEELGLLPQGYLAFTADHGEALGDNNVFGHKGDLWGARVRVPLIVHGPDLAPVRVPWTVSNVDLAPTFAALAGLEPDPGWPGSSLLAVQADRPVLAFEARGSILRIAVVEGSRKLMGSTLPELEHGRARRVFDLAADRGEQENLQGRVPWEAELARRTLPEVRAALQGTLQADRAEVDGRQLELLRELGYAGDE